MTDAEKEELQEYRRQDLLRCMKGISRNHWAAGWQGGLEHDLYLMTFHGAVPDYGMGMIDRATLERMQRLAELTGVWWVYPEMPGPPTTIPLEEAERRFSTMVAQDSNGAIHRMSIPEAKQIYTQAAASDWDLETVAPLWPGMQSWHVYRLRPNPRVSLVYREDEEDWELRFGDTAVDLVRPAWAAKPRDNAGPGSN